MIEHYYFDNWTTGKKTKTGRKDLHLLSEQKFTKIKRY